MSELSKQNTQADDDNWHTLHQLIKKYFNFSDLRDLCFRLQVDYDELGEETSKSIRIARLILDMAQNGRLDELLTDLRGQRPRVSWPTHLEVNEWSVKQYLAEQYEFQTEWFTIIQPFESHHISDKEYNDLQKEFYEGGFTRYEHILAGLDFRRERKLTEIQQAFQTDHIVIIHAASGQGKTTLAYRYLHDNYPEGKRFLIKRIENVQHALSIAGTLQTQAKKLQIPIAIYIDVHPRDTAWPELVKQLARYSLLHISLPSVKKISDVLTYLVPNLSIQILI